MHDCPLFFVYFPLQYKYGYPKFCSKKSIKGRGRVFSDCCIEGVNDDGEQCNTSCKLEA